MSKSPAWSRFVRFVSTDNRELCGEPEDPSIDVGLAIAANEEVRVNVLGGSSALSSGPWTGEVAVIRKLLSPLSTQEVGTIRCIGLNFKDHAAELKCPLPSVPEVFFKPAQCINNPFDPVVLPSSAPAAIDAEVELAVVIGRECKNVDISSALDYVLGYTIANDITARDVQARVSQWSYAKGYDGFCPLGPVLVSPNAPGLDIENLDMTTKLDGHVLQDGTSSQMIFSVAEIISYLSKDTTLPAGTLILTGTPSGIGHSYSPPRYLRAGCHQQISISSGCGTLINPVISDVAEPKL
ncbi:unnamed protein product [Clonostachys rosea]|uniref:Fumarylacetoacetase-like C-terminal domain-containing protein n=1 Tax=Bionectria ochroleuca TaxID=29856 RepID=A0ABY6UZE1_BIOOC|nr:unnamed protein product [Clonostachys rosea]